MTRTIIANADQVLTVDPDDSVVTGVSIVIDDGAITAITSDPVDTAGATVIDASHHAVMPGLVNLHTHLPMVLLRGVAEDVDLQGFLQIVWAAEGAIMDPATVELGARLGALESLRAGATTQLDMYLHHEDGHRGAAAVGARHVGGPVFFDDSGPDGRSWDDRVADLAAWPQLLADIGGPWVPPVAMPHATYTNSIDHLAAVAQGADGWDGGALHIHISENTAENADIANRYGLTPTGVLDQAGWFSADRKIVFAHGVHLTDTDRTILAGRATIAHCPGSNLKLASGAFDWVGSRQAGIRVGLGTDGCSSSNDLDLWHTMRQAALLARHVSGRADAISAAEVIRAATIDGAAALGMDHLIGSIEVGKRADLILVNLDQPHLTPIHDLAALMVFAAGRGDVTDVVVDGQPVIRNRRSTLIDTDELLATCRQRARKVNR